MNSTERLLDIKSQISDAKEESAGIKGQIAEVEEQMQIKFGAKDLSVAKKKLDKIGKELDEKESIFKEELAKLEDSYDWN